MPKYNEYVNLNKPKPVEIVNELKNEYKIPSFEEFMKTYERDGSLNYADLESSDIGDSKGYGLCKNSLCGCYCSSYNCTCASASAKIFGEWGSSVGVSGRIGEDDIDYEEKLMEGVTKSFLKMGGRPKMEVGRQVSGSWLGYKDDDGEIKILSGTAGGEINSKGIKGKLSADLYNVKHDGVQVRVGVAADTGVSIENGLEAKLAGFGFSVGKQTGISTSLGEVKVDTEDYVIQ